MQPPSILAVGVALVDIYPATGKMYPGGNEYNVSFYASELGARAGFIGVFATDETGALLRGVLEERGVDISHARSAAGYPNFALVELQKGNRVFTDWSRHAVTDQNPITFTGGDLAYAKGFDVVSLSYSCRLPLASIRQLHGAGCALSYDFSEEFTDAQLETLCPMLTFAVFSCSGESEEGVQALLQKAHGLGATIAIATMGPKGAMCHDGKEFYFHEALNAEVVDTMGAGDSFLTGFLYQYYADAHTGKTPGLAKAMQTASQNARRNIQRKGAMGIEFEISKESIQALQQKEEANR